MAEVTPTTGKGWLSFAVTGQLSHAATAAGSLGHFTNPEDVPIIITRCVFYATTSSTGACNLTVGSAASVIAAHDVANIFAAAAMAAAVGTAQEGLANGDPADALPVVAATDVIAAFASADSSGLTGVCHIEYIHV